MRLKAIGDYPSVLERPSRHRASPAVSASKGGLEVVAVRSLDALRREAPEWETLAVAGGMAQQPAFVEAAWASGACTGHLLILMAKDQGRLVGVWPLYREIAVARVLRHVGSGGREEYAGPLLAEGRDPLPILDALLQVARREGDIIELYNLEHGSYLHRFFAAETSPRRISTTTVCSLSTASAPWANWIAGRRKNLRSGLARRRRRLSEQGAVTFRQIAPSEARAHVRWCIEQKRTWLRARKNRNGWLGHDAIIDFYASLIAQDAGVQGFVLELNGATIAGEICLAGPRRLESYLTAYDPAWHAYSPGNLLTEELARWCSARQLDFDLRFPASPYKLEWADRLREVHTIVIATTFRGAIMAELKRLRGGVLLARRFARATLRRFAPSARAERANSRP